MKPHRDFLVKIIIIHHRIHTDLINNKCDDQYWHTFWLQFLTQKQKKNEPNLFYKQIAILFSKI